MTRRQIRSLIMETIRESGEIPPSGMGARARRLGRLSDSSERLMHLYMLLRQAYLDVEGALGGPDEAAERQTLEMLQAAIARTEEERAR